MRIGLITRANNSGLGNQTWELYRHLAPVKTLVVDWQMDRPLPKRLKRFPDAQVIDHAPTATECMEFLKDLDLVFTCETPYNYDLFALAQGYGVATVLQYNWEFLDYLQHPDLPLPTLFAAPSNWHIQDVPYPNRTWLPVPIATERFPPHESTRATRFLHIVGRPAVHDRNGTEDFFEALRHVTSNIEVTIHCQLHPTLSFRDVPDNVKLYFEQGDTENYWDNYTNQDVLVLPRRYGGLCLPMQEALGAGMPVIMPAIDPNYNVLESNWLVPASLKSQFMARSPIDVYRTHAYALANLIDRFATDEEFYLLAKDHARARARLYSWENLLPTYNKVLQSITNGVE